MARNSKNEWVEVKIIPMANEYKDSPLPWSGVDGDTGICTSGEIHPGRWTRVTRGAAENLRRISRGGKKIRVPDGTNLEARMENPRKEEEYVERYEGDAKFEILTRECK